MLLQFVVFFKMSKFFCEHTAKTQDFRKYSKFQLKIICVKMGFTLLPFMFEPNLNQKSEIKDDFMAVELDRTKT